MVVNNDICVVVGGIPAPSPRGSHCILCGPSCRPACRTRGLGGRGARTDGAACCCVGRSGAQSWESTRSQVWAAWTTLHCTLS